MLGSKSLPDNDLPPHSRLASASATIGQQQHGLAKAPITATTSRPEQPELTISNDKNLMPSMVVKQQRGYLTKAQVHQQHDNQATSEQPNGLGQAAPRATLDNILHQTRAAAAEAEQGGARASRHQFDQNGLVLPRRVPHHHQLADGQQPTTMRDLNRELKFNQVRGLPLLDQKSELKKAMEKLESSRRKKEAERERLTRRTSLELRLEERAQRLAAREGGATSSPGEGQPTTNSGILS